MRPQRSHVSTTEKRGWIISPTVGIVFTFVGTMGAIIAVPEDVHPATSVQVSAIIMSLGLLAAPMWTVLSSPISAVHPIHILTIAPVYWLLLDPIQGAYELNSIEANHVRYAFAMIGLFVCGVWIAALQRPWPLPKMFQSAASISFSADQLFSIAFISFALAFCRFAIPAKFNVFLMIQAFGSSRWAMPWARGAQGGWDAFLDHLSYFGYVLPCLTVLLSRAVGWFNWRTVASILFTTIILALLCTGGSRRVIGVMMGSGFVSWFLTAKLPRVKHLMFVGGMCVLLLAFMQLTLIYRNVGLFKVLDEQFRHEVNAPEHLHVDDNFLRLGEIIMIIPQHHPYVTWRWLLWVAVRPIPRVIWPGKPMDPGFDLPSFNGMKGVSLSMSLIGELYLAFGTAGCAVGGWVLGKLAITLAQVAARSRGTGAMVMFGTGLLAIFTGMRSGIELVLMSYSILAWVALVWIYGALSPGHSNYRH